MIALGAGSRSSSVIALVAAIPAAWLFLVFERRTPAPMMPASLFRNRDFAGANLLTVLLYAALSAAMFLLPYLLIEAHGYGATAAGGAFLPFSVIMGVGSRWSGGLVARFGSRALLMVGPSIVTVGFVVLAVLADRATYWTGVFPGIIVMAVGMTLTVAPLTTTVFNAAPDDKSGTASGINNAAARTGGLLAVAALGLAFGGVGKADHIAVAHAYRVVMVAAALLSGSSALTAALMLAPPARGRTK